MTHLVVAHWRNEEKTKGQERTLCLNGDPVVRTCALFNGEWRASAEGRLEMSGLRRRRVRKRPFKETRASVAIIAVLSASQR